MSACFAEDLEYDVETRIADALTAPLRAAAASVAARAEDVEALAARESFGAYLALAGRDDRGGEFILDEFAAIMIAALETAWRGGKHLNVKAPPQLGKSVFARLWLTWIAGRDPATKIGIISGDEAGAKDACGLCRQVVLSEGFGRVFPEVVPDYERSKVAGAGAGSGRDEQGWRRDGFFLLSKATLGAQAKDPTFGAYACEPTREDVSLRWLLADDVVTRKTAESLALTRRVETAFFDTWLEGRLSKGGGLCVYLQNHREDGDLGDRHRGDSRFMSVFVGVNRDLETMFVRIWHPADGMRERLAGDARFVEVDPTGGADGEWEFALPVLRGWTSEGLAKRESGALARLYRLEGARPEDLLFPAWERRTTVPPVDLAGLAREVGRGVVLAAGVDISGTKRAGNAFTVMARQGMTRWPVAHRAFKRLEDGLVWLDGLWKLGLRFERVVVEDNGVQAQMVEMIRTIARGSGWEWRGRVVGHHTGRNKMALGPEAGLPMLNLRIEQGELAWPRGMEGDSEWRALEGAFATMRIVDAAKSETTSDRVMATWKAWEGLQFGGGAGGGSRKVSYHKRRKVEI